MRKMSKMRKNVKNEKDKIYYLALTYCLVLRQSFLLMLLLMVMVLAC